MQNVAEIMLLKFKKIIIIFIAEAMEFCHLLEINVFEILPLADIRIASKHY